MYVHKLHGVFKASSMGCQCWSLAITFAVIATRVLKESIGFSHLAASAIFALVMQANFIFYP